jgi:hypothetical protein
VEGDCVESMEEEGYMSEEAPGARVARRAMCTWGAARRWMLQKPARRPGR